jgi:hypothetical protein
MGIVFFGTIAYIMFWDMRRFGVRDTQYVTDLLSFGTFVVSVGITVGLAAVAVRSAIGRRT